MKRLNLNIVKLYHQNIFQIGNTKTKIFCMIRIRRGDFNFSDDEVDAMIQDVEYFKLHGADGIVIGCLNSENQIHEENCRRIIATWGDSKPTTFHRAFDETSEEDMKKSIDLLTLLGVSRVLSSGFKPSAELGIENLKAMTEYAAGKGISIMPGAGINKGNVAKIVSETGCKEIHASARSEVKSSVASKLSMGGGSEDLQPLLVCDPIKVKELLELSNLALRA